jgi:hypothetical protein
MNKWGTPDSGTDEESKFLHGTVILQPKILMPSAELFFEDYNWTMGVAPLLYQSHHLNQLANQEWPYNKPLSMYPSGGQNMNGHCMMLNQGLETRRISFLSSMLQRSPSKEALLSPNG